MLMWNMNYFLTPNALAIIMLICGPVGIFVGVMSREIGVCFTGVVMVVFGIYTLIPSLLAIFRKVKE